MSLHDAVYRSHLERMQMLVEQGVDIEQRSGPDGKTLLHNAVGNVAVVRYLVEHGADFEIISRDGWTPLITASYNGHTATVRYLLEQGADRDKANYHGKNSLHLAAFYGHLEITKLLMLYGADLNARTKEGRLPIDCARNEEIKQAIRDEPRRRMDAMPGKRCIEEGGHPITSSSASSQQQGEEGEKGDEPRSNKQPRLDEEAETTGEGKVAEEDEDSEPSDGEEED